MCANGYTSYPRLISIARAFVQPVGAASDASSARNVWQFHQTSAQDRQDGVIVFDEALKAISPRLSRMRSGQAFQTSTGPRPTIS